MKFLVGVLALAAVCRAVPEADPHLLLGPSPLTTPYAYAPFPYAAGNVYNPYLNVLPATSPFVAPETKVITPIATPLAASAVAGLAGNIYNPYLNVLPATSPFVAPATKVITPITTPLAAGAVAGAAVLPVRPYTPYDCVTAEGCAVVTLREHGLAKREATAEADAEASADPEAFYGSHYSPYYGYNGFYNGYYPYAYGAYPYGVNSLWNYASRGLGYATGFEGYPAATAPLTAFPAPSAAPLAAAHFVPAPAVVKAAVIPAPVVQAVEVPAPVFRAVPAAPLSVFRTAPIVPAPLPVVRQPIVTPILKETAKPVTYTHLGAHPIHPTTVFEKTQEVVGHHVF